MTLAAWIPLATICILGAMSPGPSLAVVVKNTLAGGRSEGMKTAIGHSFGVGLYAFATAAGLAALLAGSPWLFTMVQWLGAFFLAWMGFKSLFPGMSGSSDTAGAETEPSYQMSGLRSGFLTAFLNPKLAIFFAALFSQFVSAQAGFGEKILMAITAGVIDALWYVVVVMLLLQSRILDGLRQNTGILNRAFGILLLFLAIRVVTL